MVKRAVHESAGLDGLAAPDYDHVVAGAVESYGLTTVVRVAATALAAAYRQAEPVVVAVRIPR